MHFLSLSCPQCAAPLPKQAHWRMVTCQYCGATVTRSDQVVEARWFHEAHQRMLAKIEPAAQRVELKGTQYRILAQIGRGIRSNVYFAERMSLMPERVIIKLGHDVQEMKRFEHEVTALQHLQCSQLSGAAYFSQRLPQVVDFGLTLGMGHTSQAGLVLRHNCGYWGSLADVMKNHPHGIDARHAVWIWRRILEVLSFAHANQWVHGDISPTHLLVHPKDHGILMTSWGSASSVAKLKTTSQLSKMAIDLQQAAWSVRALLAGGNDKPEIAPKLPTSFAALLYSASEDLSWCMHHGAIGLEQALTVAARAAFGASKFIEFTPRPHITNNA